MDHMTSLRSPFGHDMMAEFHAANVDSFSNQSGSYPLVQYGHMTSVNCQGQLEYSPPAYSLSTGQQYGHSVPQSFQPNISDRQMTSSFMCQNQPQHHPDNYYPYQTQTPPFFPQKHQPGTAQILQSPTSPCHNQTSSVNIYQSHSPQFAPLPVGPQSAQISPRNSGHHQTSQNPMVISQKTSQIQALQNQQHQSTVQMNGYTQHQRSEQSPKLVVSKQQNNPKDPPACDGLFYSAQSSKRPETSLNSLHKTQVSVSSFGHRMQPPSPAHASHVFQTGGANAGTKANGDSRSRNLQGGQLGASVKTHAINQIKPGTYMHTSGFEHPTTTVQPNLQQNRYGKNDSLLNSAQRNQKAAPITSALSYRPQLSSNPNCYPDHSALPAYSNVASNHTHCSVSSIAQPVKPISDHSARNLSSAQNLHYKSRNPQTVLTYTREGKNIINPGNVSNRSARSIPSDSGFLESHLVEYSQSRRMDDTNPCSVFSVAALSDFAKGGTSGIKVSDPISKGNNKNIVLGKTVQKSTHENLSPVHWYKCPGSSLVSSFQSDIEAMQADVASYVPASGTFRASNRAPTVLHGAPTAQRSVELNASSQIGLSRTSQAHETQKSGTFSRTEGQSCNDSSKPEGHSGNKTTRAQALAAIQIKQELVDSLHKYKAVNSSSTSNSLSTNTTTITKAAPQISSTSVTHSIKDINFLTDRLSAPVKLSGGNVHPQAQSNISAKRHSSVELDSRSLEQTQGTSANMSFFVKTNSKSLDLTTKTAADDSSQDQKVVNKIKSGQQFIVQNRRNIVSFLPGRISPSSQYETLPSPDQRQNVDIQRSHAQRQSTINLDFPSQSIMHHLFDQVQSIEAHHPSSQLQNIATINKTVQKDSTVDKSGQRQSVPCEKKVLPACENVFDTWATGQAVRSGPAGAIDLGQRSAASMISTNSTKESGLDESTKRTSFINNLQSAENVNRPVPMTTLRPETCFSAKRKLIQMESSNESNRLPTSIVCTVMLHGHKLICLQSNSENFILLSQFQLHCFPDRSMESIDSCIDQTLQINRKILNHQDKEKIILLLKKSGYNLGSVVQTISLGDARRVYHNLYGITYCTDSACVVNIFQNEADLDLVVSSSNDRHITQELKKEKKSADDNSYGKLVSNISHVASSNTYAGTEHYQNRTEDKTKHPQDKSVNSQLCTPLQPQSNAGLGSPGNDLSFGKDVDNDESDDLILVEASEEDPHLIHWSGDAPKTGGLCNTIVGQLRSYIHENERFLVVDDLCRVFGSADFYDGVERENIILYSCCQGIADFLTTINAHFPPIQSRRDSLVKEKDIGIHITATDYVPAEGALEKSVIGSLFLKRPLCKQELIDEDCSSPKQLRLEDREQVPGVVSQLFTEKQPSVLNQRQVIEKSIINKEGSDSGHADVSKIKHSDNLVVGIEGTNMASVICSEEINQPFTVSKSPGESVQDKNSVVSVQVAMDVSSEVPSKSAEKRSLSSIVSRFSSQTLENNNDTNSTCIVDSPLANINSLNDICLKKTHQLAQVNEHDACRSESPPVAVADIAGDSCDKSNLMNTKETDDISLVRPNDLSSPESSGSRASLGESSPILIDLNNLTTSLSTNKEETISQNKLKSKVPESACQDGHFGDSLTEMTFDNILHAPRLHISVRQSLDSEYRSNNHENVGNLNDLLETTMSKQTDDLKINSPHNGAVDCLEDLISAQQNAGQEKSITNSISSTLRTRVEKLQHILETRKNKDLPLPKLFLENSLNLGLLTNADSCAKDNNYFTDISRTETAVQKSSKLDHSTFSLNSYTEVPIGDSDITCAPQNVMKPGSDDQSKDNSDLFLHEDLTVREAANNNSQVALPEIPIPLSEHQTSGSPQGRSTYVLSVLDLDKDQTQLPILPLLRCAPGHHRSVDDIDVTFSSISDLSGVPPSSYARAYAKLWQENRALLGVMDELKKSLADAKTENERSERVLKYYEGVIHDITSTFKNGGEEVPVVLNIDVQPTVNGYCWILGRELVTFDRS